MTWNREPFEFEENSPAPGDRIIVPINLENVIIEGTKIIHDQKRLEEELPNLDFALKFRESPGEALKNIQLSTADWRVVGFVNPKNSIRQIARACNMTDTEIRRVVHALREAGLVELVKPPSAVKTSKPGARGLRAESKAGQPSKAVVNRLIAKIKEI
jgi:hypothetical protein